MGFDQGYALLIGVGTYQNEPSLNVPVTSADATALAALLGDAQYCGYPTQQITLLCDADATRAAVFAALDALATQATKDSTVFLFYSGHGHYGEDGSYYLTTNDMQLTPNRKVADGTAIRHDELLSKLQHLAAERVLLIFNACHSGEISPTLAVDQAPFTGAPLPDQTAAALLSTGSGRLIITACREKQYAYVGDGGTTIFTQALLDGLRGQGISSQRGFISAFDLYTQLYFNVTQTVQRDIPAATRQQYSATQEPELTVLKGVGPFAVALYQGATATLGDFSAPAQPAAGTAVRAVDAAESRALFDQIQNVQQTQSGGINFGVGNRIGSIGDVVAGDKIGGDQIGGDKIDARGSQGFINRPTGTVNQVTGTQQNIDTSGGTFVQGDQFNLSGNIQGSNVNIKSTLTNVNQSIGNMPHGDQSDKDQLKQLIAQLNAALQQAPQKDDAETVATFAQQLIDTATKPQPNKSLIAITASGLQQAAANIATALPAVLDIATKIVEKVKQMTA